MEALEHLHTVLLREVSLYLHDDDVPLLRSCSHAQDLLHAAVIQVRDAEVHVRLVVRGLVGVRLRSPKATPQGPGDDHALAELGVLGVPLQEPIHPIKGALVRQHHREHDLVFPVCRLWVCCDHHILLRGVLQHAAREGKRHVVLGAEVHMHRNVPEGQGREEDLPLQVLGQRLGRTCPLPFFEEGDGARVGAAFIIEVEDHRNGVVSCELL
mmetsp:Transcript_150314/g.418832  ORF Transcript_150314/g.418832 Transcript_150314/m.418832 type:complete len:212 (+) Transcript_150314:1482-2117(+)